MNNIGWGIIGVPNGFQHISQGMTANETINRLDERIRREEYKEESLFAVIYDTPIVESGKSRQLMVYFVQYNFAKETEKDRLGSFYGSYIALPGRLPSNIECCKEIVRVLQELSCYNQEIFMEGDKFKKNYSNDYELPPELGEAVEKIIKNTVMGELPTEKFDIKKSIIVYANSPSEVFLNSVELYDIYSRIYTSNNEDYCRYIDEGSNANYKELADLEKESFDIVEARRIEQERIERYNREIEEKKIREQEQAEREEQERFKIHEEDVQNLFQDMGILFLFSEKSSSLVEFVNKYKAGSYSFQELKEMYEALETNANEAKRVSNIFEERKLELLAELKKIRSFDQQPKDELKLANEAAEAYPDPKPAINPMKTSNGYNGIKPEGNRGATSNYNGQNNDNQLNTNGFSVKSIIIGVLLIIIVLAIIAGIYFFFSNKESEPAKSSLTLSTTQDNNINNGETSLYQDSNEILNTDTEYKEIDFESTMGNSSSSLNYSAECNYDEKNIRYYTVTQVDIMDNGQLRLDSEIISKIMEGISRKESAGNLPSINKDEFEKMLMDCNDELNYKKYNSSDLLSNTLLTVVEGSKVKYFK